MGRPKLKEEEKKCKLGVTISRDLYEKINTVPNKSKLIENLLDEYFNATTIGESNEVIYDEDGNYKGYIRKKEIMIEKYEKV